MTYGKMPLFPGGCGENECLRMPLFGGECGCRRGCGEHSQTVRICNPSCPGEYADVELGVDSCGILSICIHRPPRDCCSGYRRKRC